MNPLVQMQQLGQSPWHDNIKRSLLTSGKLKKMIDDGDITGLTSNPTIFEQAITGSTDYDETLGRLAKAGKTAEEIFDALAIEDIRAAADLFRPVFERTRGADGFVSIEVNPKMANDTKATIAEAKRLWRTVDKPNLMVKIPATAEGIPAIEESLADGTNINITLIFSLDRYEAVMEAYQKALERRVAKKEPIRAIASVASFFVSRVDSAVDKLIDEKKLSADLSGKAAIGNAVLAYERFLQRFSGPRWDALAKQGARVQRPLWASTSTKNPKYPDVYFVEALIGPDTVDTLPPATIDAYKDHGKPERRLDKDFAGAHATMKQLKDAGIDMGQVVHKLEVDGVASFSKSFESLLSAVEARRKAVK
jgi:transaldolase/glucose-6-phosphate isomerase